mgnify:CR=1 FL=1
MRTVYDADLLLVDDNPDLLRLLSDQLSGAGYRHIRTAANCAAAQTAFACKTPELMILDINLPDGDGFSLFRFLREKVDVPALFLSGCSIFCSVPTARNFPAPAHPLCGSATGRQI